MKRKGNYLLTGLLMLALLMGCGGRSVTQTTESQSEQQMAQGTETENAGAQGGDGTQTPGGAGTEKPSEAESQKPSEAESQKPSETESQKPSETESQMPSETESQKPSEAESQQPAETQKPAEIQKPTPKPQVPEEPGVTTITISAVGDVTLGINQKTSYPNSFHDYYDKYGADYFLKEVREYFEADDLTIANFEGTLTETDNYWVGKQWLHKGKPEYTAILTGSSVEAVTLGNNHIYDYQQEGIRDTVENVKNAGLTYAISSTWWNQLGLYETKGIKIGLVSVDEFTEGNAVYQMLEDGYQELRGQGADLVIACTHWGGDKVHEINNRQYKLGRWCIDYGFDLVVGCHPHVIQGVECYKGKYIVYSMGNFCYGGNKNPKEKESMIFQQTFRFKDGQLLENAPIRVLPCRLSSVTSRNDYCPVVLTGKDAEAWTKQFNGYCKEFDLEFDTEGYLK